MANNYAEIIPRLLGQGVQVLRANAITVQLVNRGYESVAAEKGSTVDVPVSSSVTATDVVPANVAPNPGDDVPDSVPIELSQWKEGAWQMSEKDEMEVMNGYLPLKAQEAVKAVVDAVDAYVLSLYKKTWNVIGTPATLPFASGLTTNASAIDTTLSEALAPPDNRWCLLTPRAQGNALDLRAFQDISWNGSPDGIVNSQLNKKFNIAWFMNQNLPTHTAGTGSGYVAGATSAGATTVAVSGGTGTFKAGDVIYFAGHTQPYVIVSDVASVAASIAIQPALRANVSGSTAITIVASHGVNLFAHRDAIAFASRPLRTMRGDTLYSMVARDPVSGLALRAEVRQEFKRTRYAFDILFGAAMIRPELAGRLLQ